MIAVYITGAVWLIGYLAPFWFGKLFKPVRVLRSAGKWLDSDPLQLPAAPVLTIEKVRTFEKTGDKIVVAHHLGGWSRDLQRKFVGSMTWAPIISALALISGMLLTMPTVRSADSPAALVKIVTAAWPISFAAIIPLFEALYYARLVADQHAKYAELIQAARPPSLSLAARIAGFRHRLRTALTQSHVA